MTTTLQTRETATLATLVQRSGTRFVLAMFVDLTGKLCAKLVPAAAVDEFESNGVGFAGYAVGAIGQQPRDPDIMAIPDVDSFTPIDFVKPGLALVHCDPHVEGRPWKFAPRVILKQMLRRAAELDLDPFVGAEVEYFLVNRDAAGALSPADSADLAAQPCYDARGVTRMFDHLAAVSTAMNDLGWANYANDHEDANGQFEQNFAYADALTTADRVITARYLISMLAESRGMTATFMPKPFTDRTGTGLHLHVSMWRDGQALFPAGEVADDYGLGLSQLAYSFLGGVLDHACGLQAVLGPTVNSYKRTGAGSTASGATWAPRQATYGGNDRTHYIRVPEGNRFELRGADGSANPYLAIATVLGAGLAGVRDGVDPGAPGGDNGRTRTALPPTLLHAAEAFADDAVLRDVLDSAGPGVADYFADRERDEFFRWHSAVSSWELDKYLTAF